MQLAEVLAPYRMVGITGNAGAGKTTLAHTLGPTPYSVDFRFIGDSSFRRHLLASKGERIDAYVDACNQYNWWNWDQVEKDLLEFSAVGRVTLETSYDRDTGAAKAVPLVIEGKQLIVEGALLGPSAVVKKLGAIVFVYEPADSRFQRLVKKDAARRTFSEIVARFLITEYSETLYYSTVLANYPLIFVDREYQIIDRPALWIEPHQFLPIDLGTLWTR